eukprot:5972413-Pyramimonas_sp.AAC.1
MSCGLEVKFPYPYPDPHPDLHLNAQSLLTTGSKNAQGKYDYNVATVPLLAELLKLMVSAVLLFQEYRRNPNVKMTTDIRSVMLYPIPSIIYLGHHSITFPLLAYVDPRCRIIVMWAVYKLGTHCGEGLGVRNHHVRVKNPAIGLHLPNLGQLEDRNHGSGGQVCPWKAPVTAQMVGTRAAHTGSHHQPDFVRKRRQPVCRPNDGLCTGTFAGVYTEFLMKKNDDSLHWQ